MKNFLIFLTVLFCLQLNLIESYFVDTNAISTSGFSSGAFFAVQYHIAYSSQLTGAAIFAGGPYYCAEGSETTALTKCMTLPSEINVGKLVDETQNFEKQGHIDVLNNLTTQAVFLFSAKFDTVVNTGVVKKLAQYYDQVANGISVKTNYDVSGEHTFPTTDYGNQCTMLKSPYVGRCNYDGAGTALQTIMKQTLVHPSSSYVQSNILKFEQSTYVPQGAKTTGLAQYGYAYVPTNCRNLSKQCSLHVSFHGCNQDYDKVDDSYYGHAGFNTWAETNNIIIVYPQAAIIKGSNPNGCWDWWGFTGKDYAFKTGVQLATVNNIVNAVSLNSTSF
eukprot:TRINITY_DN2982_c4_g1_i1.p1 TRINITY_DN2982_c4_g1~~TRINITY_DN2982_c4_g1_i1.p1  ORF type:complete len:333 (-),score=151.03 TRINITY_DN2982_c4_g1_i1:70-1068(-)